MSNPVNLYTTTVDHLILPDVPDVCLSVWNVLLDSREMRRVREISETEMEKWTITYLPMLGQPQHR